MEHQKKDGLSLNLLTRSFWSFMFKRQKGLRLLQVLAADAEQIKASTQKSRHKRDPRQDLEGYF